MTKPQPLRRRRADPEYAEPVPVPVARWVFQRLPAGAWLTTRFDAPYLSSDGGLPWLVQADAALGLCQALAACVPEWRRGGVRHALRTLVQQRVFQIACGYADQDDADHLRTDPLFKLACGRAPLRGPALASQPTLSRLENAVDRHAVEALATALVHLYIRARGRTGAPTHVVLDVDGTDDPTHGDQEGSAYHGYYRQHMDHPLLLFDGTTGQLITAVLRPGNVHGSRFAVLVLRRVVRLLRAAWPAVQLEVRADSGFGLPRLYRWCEDHGLRYVIGLIPNPVLEQYAAPLLAAAHAQSEALGGEKVRLAADVRHQAGSWAYPRRVVFKAEVLEQGPNTRFVVTNRPDAPLALYDWYVDRGAAENWIKDLKNALAADRLSDHRFWANAFRLVLHAAAYWLLDTLRRWLAPVPEVAHAQLDTLRLQVLKVGGWIEELVESVGADWFLHLSAHHPGARLWPHLARATRAYAYAP